MDVYAQIIVNIIDQQETIIGPVAIEQAKQINGLKVDWKNHTVSVTGDEAAVVDKLVVKYKELFGKISVEVCKQAASKLITQLPKDKQPHSLQ